MSFEQIAKESGFTKGFANAKTVIGGSMVAHLSAASVFSSDFRHQTSFIDRTSQRFLAETVFAKTHAHQAGGGVHVVGSRAGERVDLVAHLVEHFAEVGEFGSVCVTFQSAAAFIGVRIANCNQIAGVGGVCCIRRSFAGNANSGEVNLFVRRFARGEIVHQNNARASNGGGLQKVTT